MPTRPRDSVSCALKRVGGMLLAFQGFSVRIQGVALAIIGNPLRGYGLVASQANRAQREDRRVLLADAEFR